MNPCRAYHAPAHLVCGLMEDHDSWHWAAGVFGGRLRRFKFRHDLSGEHRAPSEWGYPR